jgi:uncharacterized protein YuzE
MSVSHPDRLAYLLDGKEQLSASYDEQADILYLWRGDAPREAVTLNSEEGYLVRLDPDTYKVVGFTIFDFCRRWQEDDHQATRLTVTIPSFGFRSGKTTKPRKHELAPYSSASR